MNLGTKITIYKFTPQVFTLTLFGFTNCSQIYTFLFILTIKSSIFAKKKLNQI